MAEFMRRFGTQEQCETALTLARWPQGFACPERGSSSRTSFRRQGRLYWQCGACQHQCSLTRGSILENTKLPLTIRFLAMHLLTQAKNNVAALEVMAASIGRDAAAASPGAAPRGTMRVTAREAMRAAMDAVGAVDAFVVLDDRAMA
jgi:hypothetical protein